MAYFPELRAFMKNVYHNSTAQRLAQDMMAVGKATSANGSSYRIVSVSSLRDLLPDRSITDRLVQKYLSTFETTYRILHIPTFQNAYEQYWDVEKPGSGEMDAVVLSMLACTPSMVSRLEADCAAPGNFNDVQLSPSLEELPPSEPMEIFTDTSFLFISTRSVGFRSSLCALTNSLQSRLSFQDTLSHANTIEDYIQSIPNWIDSGSLQVRVLLDLQLRQLLVILYAANTADAGATLNTERRYSIIALMEAAAATTALHTALTASSNLALCCTRSDYYRAALLVCHAAYHANKVNDTMVVQAAKSTLDSCAQQALRLQEERVMLVGRGGQQHWVLSAAVGLASVQFEPSHSDAVKLQAIDRVSRLLYRMLSRKDISEEPPANEVLLQDAPRIAKQINSHSGYSAEALSTDSFADVGLRIDAFDFGETSEWMLDDFWFLNEPFGSEC
ncbi:hypothetical protein GT037_009301 [Alternaria burnsii]|uniref:Transcription factor domain-containing protein n=1 Tax=Alternaria burnsii TaxID=1187904 RepID=A0A8H7AY93_9PLEO|nr:uncharacterized protein GT037_009301 [Alternaria burnsii]KAF7672800.1 hypothetical protein GT037_009301 [Alternaria burnsii]